MLKEVLAAKGITPAELGRRINRSPRMVNYYLSGEWPIPSDVARNIASSTASPWRSSWAKGRARDDSSS